MTRIVLAGQGLYFIATGLWAIFSIGTFQAVTGPKVDTWLVKTVGALVLVVGAVLAMAGVRRRPPAETAVLAGGSALAFAAVDTVYVAKGRISPVYLLDAAAELAGVTLLARSWRRR